MPRKLLLLSAVLTGTLVAGCSSTRTELSPPREAINITTPVMQINPTQLGVDQIVVERLDLMGPGFVVIRADDGGKPGAVLSHSVMLEKGRHEGIGVTIDPARAGDRVIAVVHADDGNVLFEFPGPDGPMMVNGNMLMGVVKLK